MVLAVPSVGRSQVADTIWAGDLPISGISFRQIEEGALKYPAVSGGKMTVPVEIWFWNDGSAWLMFDYHRWGLVDRQPRFDPWLPRGPGSSRWESTSTWAWSARSRKGSFKGKSTRLVDSEWHYRGYFLAWSGNFVISGNKMTVSKMVLGADRLAIMLGSSDDPKNRANGIQLGKMPTFGPSLVLVKVADRKPSESMEGVEWD